MVDSVSIHYPEPDLPVVVVADHLHRIIARIGRTRVSGRLEAALNTIGGIDNHHLGILRRAFDRRGAVPVDVDSQDGGRRCATGVARLETKFPDGVATPQVTRYKAGRPGNPLCCSVSTSRTLPEITTLATRVINNRPERYIGVAKFH